MLSPFCRFGAKECYDPRITFTRKLYQKIFQKSKSGVCDLKIAVDRATEITARFGCGGRF